MDKVIIVSKNPDGTIHETYHEKQIGNTLYRVTSEYKGEFDFKTEFEKLIVRKIVRELEK